MWGRRSPRDEVRLAITGDQFRCLRADVLDDDTYVYRTRRRRREDIERLGHWAATRLDVVCATDEPRRGVPHIPDDIVDGLAQVCERLRDAAGTPLGIDGSLATRTLEELSRIGREVILPDSGGDMSIPAVGVTVRGVDPDRRARWTAVADAQGFRSIEAWASDVIAGIAGAGWVSRIPSPSVRRATGLCRQVEHLLRDADSAAGGESAAVARLTAANVRHLLESG